MLERQGYQIVAAENGEKALEIMRRENPNLVLLDVMMPDMDGFEVARKIRNDEKYNNIPIIMFTAKSRVEDKITGLESGADVYLTKPTQPRELFAQIKVLLARSKKSITTPLPINNKRGFLVGVIAAKGGLGVSSTVINLGITVFKYTNQDSLVVDFYPGRGDISWELGYTAQTGLSKLLDSQISQITPEIIANQLVIHDSGIKLLLSSQSPKEAGQIFEVENLKEIASKLPQVSRWIIMDLGSNLFPATQSLAKLCDILVVVLSPNPGIIYQTRALMGDLLSLGVGESRILPIMINKVRSPQQLNIHQTENQLGYKIESILSPAPELAYQASISNQPIVLQQSDSEISQQFINLAKLITSKNPQWNPDEPQH
jgi:CheY-like chemotaxis protein/MinD-like ATPase involved in chromosome partitioning or flagellar assembly